jgi:hypothetical protein
LCAEFIVVVCANVGPLADMRRLDPAPAFSSSHELPGSLSRESLATQRAANIYEAQRFTQKI